eukprot:TRINITY_DN10093_c0_g1_i1.p1 TRINITY_DN10093_c0_g1~~TRINITY_DN10093_c0_g1_i1.p1  ORF type:complete len:323 (-),score=77.29 TRINITY_DN10093_c0_g1_i1:38-1006(-)
MNKALLLLAVLAVSAFAVSLDDSFGAYVSKHNKQYESEEEYSYRKHVYAANLELIEAHNRKNLGYTLGINQFADLTAQEFGYMYNTLQQRPSTLKNEVELFDLPTAATVDWRTKGAVTPVKNQGQCGSCWAFSATGSMEGAYFLAGNSLTSLSEQNLVDCSTSEGNMGCNGGLMDYAFTYVIKNNGIDTESSYPYTATGPNSCKFQSSGVGATIKSYKDVQSGSESQLTSALSSVGPISVAIDASHSSFQFYSGGVYYEAACSSSQLDHGVLAVGYGTESGSDYYIVKNSWGSSWGMSGYILMARNRSNNCGIATAASYPIA